MWFKYIHNNFTIEVSNIETINRLLKDSNYQVFEPIVKPIDESLLEPVDEPIDEPIDESDVKQKRTYTKRKR